MPRGIRSKIDAAAPFLPVPVASGLQPWRASNLSVAERLLFPILIASGFRCIYRSVLLAAGFV
jgi:hypothetical protein